MRSADARAMSACIAEADRLYTDSGLRTSPMSRPRRRAGRHIRGGQGRSELARLRPVSRARLSRRLAAERLAAAASLQRHAIDVVEGLASCVCGWTGPGSDAVPHMFSQEVTRSPA